MGFKLEEAVVLETIPDGTMHSAEIVKCEERDHPFFKEDDGVTPQREVSFTFKITDGDYAERYIYGRTPTTFTTHPDCKLRGWVQSAYSLDEVPLDFEFEPEDLNGLPVKIIAGVRKYVDKQGKDREQQFVQDLLPFSNSHDPYANEPF